jgi:hypothetical protein
MKKLILALTLLLTPTAAFSQTPDSLSVSMMKKVAVFKGQWKGSGWISFAAGKKETFVQNEDVRTVTDGSMVTMEGLGQDGSAEGKVVHRAFGVVFYDVMAQKLKIHAYKDGKFIAADAEVAQDGSFLWGFDAPGGTGKIRYTIRINEKGQWYEVGQFSPDGGKTWFQNFEMTLDRV